MEHQLSLGPGPARARHPPPSGRHGAIAGSLGSGLDSVTGLPDRQALLDRPEAAEAHERPRRQGLTALVVGLDRFRRVNEALGLCAGDEVLRLVAHRLRGCVRPDETLARIGADEFALLLEAAAG